MRNIWAAKWAVLMKKERCPRTVEKEGEFVETERFELIGIDRLTESPLNTRRHFNQHEFDELVESIRTHGVITPLLVRPACTATGVDPGPDVPAPAVR